MFGKAEQENAQKNLEIKRCETNPVSYGHAGEKSIALRYAV